MNDVSKRTSSKKSSTSNKNSIDELDCQFIVETTFAPKPFLLPISTEQLHCAIILFSPMRPLSFVRIDSFIDRVLHVQNLKIIILVVDVDVLGSEAAIASLNETSRCRPVSRSDLKQYVKLKRRLFSRIDEYEENARTAQQQQQGSFGAGGDGGRFSFGDNSSFAASAAANDAKSRPSIVNKRELIVCVHQKHEWMKPAAAISSSSSQSSSTSSSSSSFPFPHNNIQLLSALKWCFGRQFGESVERKIFGSTTTTNMIARNSISSSSPNKHDAVAAAEEHFGEHFESSSSSSDDDDDDDENFIDKHTRENQQENEDGVSFNDVAWYLEWEHQLHQARQFYRQQKALFGDQSSSSRSSNKKWIMIPLQPKSSTTQDGQADSAEFAPASSDFSSADFSSPVRRIGSAAFLLTPSSSSRLSFHQYHHQHRKSIVLSSSDHSVSPSPLSSTTTNRPAQRETNDSVTNSQTEEQEKVQGEKSLPPPPLRFAFWDPTTNQISLTIPKQIVADMQVQRFLEEANEKDTHSTQKAKQDDKVLLNSNSASVASSSNDNTPPPEQDADNEDDNDDEEEGQSPSLTNFLTKRSRSFSMMYNQNNSSSILEQQQKDISFYASCPPHQAKKALIMADKLREESYREAEKNMTKRLQSLQEHLTSVEKKNRDLNANWNELQQQRDELKLTREAVKEKVYQTQKSVIKLKLERDRIALLNHTSTSPSETIDSNNTNGNQQQSLQYAITEAEHRLELLQNQLSGLSSWKSQQCKKQEAELLQYERSGGKQELIRQYYARFLENQQVRADLNKIVERNDEIQSEIDVVRGDEFMPLFHRKKALEGRKNQLLLEIHELVADDMVKEKNVNRFLDQVATRRRKREHEETKRNMKDQSDEDNNFSSSLSSSNSNSSLDSFSSSSSSDSDFDENPEKLSPHLFQSVIRHLRQKLRSIQNSFRFDPVHLLKPIGICRSPALHQVIEKAEIIYEEEYENDHNSNHDWIAEFIRNSKQALDSMLYYSSSSSSSSSARTSAVPIHEMNLNLRREIIDRKMLLLTINEVIARQQLKCDEATKRMLVLQAAALVHTRNYSVKSIELAKAKRKALV